jgi:single-strand DNA-binding protein
MATHDKGTVSSEEATPQAAARQRGPSLNRVSLIDRLTADPQLRHTPNGIAVAKFTLANNGTDGVQFYTVVAWRRLGEVAAEYLSKGRLVYVSGRLTGRTWTAPDGTGRYAVDIVAGEIQFLSPKRAAMGAAA